MTDDQIEAAHCLICSTLMERTAEAWRCGPCGRSYQPCPKCGYPLVGATDLWCAECRK